MVTTKTTMVSKEELEVEEENRWQYGNVIMIYIAKIR